MLQLQTIILYCHSPPTFPHILRGRTASAALSLPGRLALLFEGPQPWGGEHLYTSDYFKEHLLRVQFRPWASARFTRSIWIHHANIDCCEMHTDVCLVPMLSSRLTG